MHLDEGHETAHPPRRRHLLQKFEGATDLMVVALIVLLGGGHAVWPAHRRRQPDLYALT